MRNCFRLKACRFRFRTTAGTIAALYGPTMAEASRDLTRTVLAVLAIGGLIAATFWVLRPFLLATIWATMVVVATWSLMLRVQSYVRGKRGVAVTVMVLFLLLVFVLPLSLAVSALIDNADVLAGWARSLSTFTLPPPPDWLAGLPLVGEKLASFWQDLAAGERDGLIAKVAPYAGAATRWLFAQLGTVGLMSFHFLLTVLIAAIMYAGGEEAAVLVHRFGRRLAGERGAAAIDIAGGAIRGVALGVVVTALVQSFLGGIGLAVVGIPFASLLTAVMFLLCIAQLGPSLVLVPAVAWLYWTGDTVWATVLLVWCIPVVTLDNFLRPILIKRGLNLPLLLIFAGVIGGLIAFGLIGLFVGPVVLAVTYRLFMAWVDDDIAGGAPGSVGMSRGD
jgi:predicted PurR-regulated permease PerM